MCAWDVPDRCLVCVEEEGEERRLTDQVGTFHISINGNCCESSINTSSEEGLPHSGRNWNWGFYCLIVCIAFYIINTVNLSCPWNHWCTFLKAIYSTDALTIADVSLVGVAIASRSLCDFKESERLLLWALKKLEARQLEFKPPALSCFRLCNCLLFCLKSFTPSSPLCSAVIIDGFELTTIPQHKLF